MNGTSMNFTSFTQTILKNLQEKLGDDYSVFSHTVKKNNGVTLTGIMTKRKNFSASPAFYIDDLYREGISQEEIRGITDTLCSRLQNAELREDPDLSDFMEFDRAKEKLAFKLIHAERNRELLQEIPHKLFHDLALVFYYTVQEAPFYGNAAILVYNSHLRQWKVSEHLLLQTALENTPTLFPAVIENMQEVMEKILMDSLEDDLPQPTEGEENLFNEGWKEELTRQMLEEQARAQSSMFVLSNRQKLYGAACMLYPGVLKAFAKQQGKDLYILPSSIHEVILIPADKEISYKELREIVTEVNRTQVAEDEVLADSVYYYKHSRDEILRLS